MNCIELLNAHYQNCGPKCFFYCQIIEFEQLPVKYQVDFKSYHSKIDFILSCQKCLQYFHLEGDRESIIEDIEYEYVEALVIN